ncbi:MAG: hypothetical protein FWH40_00195 [Coriobacteriia bacterium]|nr:hypothetical protein [Coriobacteriia bacterium]
MSKTTSISPSTKSSKYLKTPIQYLIAVLIMITVMVMPSVLFADDEPVEASSPDPAIEEPLAALEDNVPQETLVLEEESTEPDIVLEQDFEDLVSIAEILPSEEAPASEAESIIELFDAVAEGGLMLLAEGFELEVEINDYPILEASYYYADIENISITLEMPADWYESLAGDEIDDLVSFILNGTTEFNISVADVLTEHSPAVTYTTLFCQVNRVGETYVYSLVLGALPDEGVYTVKGLLNFIVYEYSFVLDKTSPAPIVVIPYGYFDERDLIPGAKVLNSNQHYRYQGIYVNTDEPRIRDLRTQGNSSWVNLDGANYRQTDSSAVLNLADYINLASGSHLINCLQANSQQMLHDSFDFSITFQYYIVLKHPVSNQEVYIRIEPIEIELVGSGSFIYGTNLVEQINNESFINDHIVIKRSGTSNITSQWLIHNSVLSLFSTSANNELIIYTDADSLTSYPLYTSSPMTWAWCDESYFDLPSHLENITLTGELQTFFTLYEDPPFESIVKNSDMTNSIYDEASNTIWINTKDAILDDEGGLWGFGMTLSWPNGDLVDPMTDLPYLADPVDLIGIIVKSNNPANPWAVFLPIIKNDLTAPLLSSIVYPTDDLTTYGFVGLTATETDLVITITVIDQDEDPTAYVSGLSKVEVMYLPYASDPPEDEIWPIEYLVDSELRYEPYSFDLVLSSEDSYRWLMGDFTLSIIDVAGNTTFISLGDVWDEETDAASQTIKYERIIFDNTYPYVSIATDLGSGLTYISGDVVVQVSVDSFHFAELKEARPNQTVAYYTAGSTSQMSIAASEFDFIDGRWLATLPIQNDGSYMFYPAFTDLLGRSFPHPDDTASPTAFVIDTMAPSILVEFDNENSHSFGYFNAPRRATIDVLERNLDSINASVSAWDAYGNEVSAPGLTSPELVEEDNYIAYIYFNDEYSYSFTVSATDLAGNSYSLDMAFEFTIDMTPPDLTVENVSDSVAYAGLVNPQVSFYDLNLEDYTSTVEIVRTNGLSPYLSYSSEKADDYHKVIAYLDFPHELGFDDVYYLIAQATDKAGNVTEQRLVFSVNRFGSTYWFDPMTQAINGTYTNKPQDLVIHEVNVSGLDESSIIVRLSINGFSEELAPGLDYRLESEVTDPDLWHMYTYSIPASRIVNDGRYYLTVRSLDNAGLLSESIMPNKNADRTGPAELSFVLDKTAPLGSIDGIFEDGVYITDAHQISLYIRDNISWQSAKLEIDGTVVMEWHNTENTSFERYQYTMSSQTTAQTIKLSVTDKAGNTFSTEISNVIISSDLWIIVTKTPFWTWWGASAQMRLILTIINIVVLGILFLIVFIIVRRRRRDEEEKQIVFSGSDEAEGSDDTNPVRPVRSGPRR